MAHRYLSSLLLLFTLLSGATANADELRVAVASNFAPVLERLAPLFEQVSGHLLVISPGATGRHYTQIVNGAPFDVFLAADVERPRLLEERGLAVADSRQVYAQGALVLWSRTEQLVDGSADVLFSDTFQRLALANPRLAPYGAAAREVLEMLDLWQALAPRVVQGENINQTLQFVASGNAELGFIARSQWLEIDPQRQGSYWEVPAALHAPIAQAAVLLRDSPAGRALLDFLRGTAAVELITAAGYTLP